MTETKEERAEAKRLADEKLAVLLADETAEAGIAEVIRTRCPKLAAATVLELVEALAEHVNEMTSGFRTMEAVGAHIEMSHVDYPSGSVMLDAAGDLMGVEFNVATLVDY